MNFSILDLITTFLAEFIGTLLLVLMGCMGCIQTNYIENNHLQMTLNFGLVVTFMIQIFGHISGAHFNPAVTAAAFVYKLISLRRSILYFFAQMIGSCFGYGLIVVLVPYDAWKGVCLTIPNPRLNVIQAVAIEFWMTAILIFVCCGVWDPRNSKNTDSVAIKFGLTVASLGIIAGSWTGASMNPARSFGPAIWNLNFSDHWVYWVGPLTAGFIISFMYKKIFWRNPNEDVFINTEKM